jgi:hypothetical protein
MMADLRELTRYFRSGRMAAYKHCPNFSNEVFL